MLAFTRSATTWVGMPMFNCQMIEPVRILCGLREDGHLLA